MKERIPPFYVGQKIVEINPGTRWFDEDTDADVEGPNGEIVTCRGCYWERDTWYVLLVEYSKNAGDGYVAVHFRPVE